MKKHTPGPWRAETFICATEGKPIEGYTVKPECSPDDSLLDINFGEGWSREEVEANARLIAAAPELLEACEYVIKWHREHDSGEGELFGLDFVTTCINAVRKANGERS